MKTMSTSPESSTNMTKIMNMHPETNTFSTLHMQHKIELFWTVLVFAMLKKVENVSFCSFETLGIIEDPEHNK